MRFPSLAQFRITAHCLCIVPHSLSRAALPCQRKSSRFFPFADPCHSNAEHVIAPPIHSHSLEFTAIAEQPLHSFSVAYHLFAHVSSQSKLSLSDTELIPCYSRNVRAFPLLSPRFHSTAFLSYSFPFHRNRSFPIAQQIISGQIPCRDYPRLSVASQSNTGLSVSWLFHCIPKLLYSFQLLCVATPRFANLCHFRAAPSLAIPLHRRSKHILSLAILSYSQLYRCVASHSKSIAMPTIAMPSHSRCISKHIQSMAYLSSPSQFLCRASLSTPLLGQSARGSQ